jgi:hypothetical protein
MQYNPTVADRSGEILGQGQSNASMLQMQGMQGMGQDLGAAIASLAGSYAKGRADQAKAKAYTEFLDMHGETLGVQPEWLEEFRKKKPQEQLAMGDLLVGSMLPHQQRMQYLERQGEIFPRGGGGDSSAGEGDYVVGQGWMGGGQ